MIVRDRQRETMKERGVLKRPSTRMDEGDIGSVVKM